MTTSSFMVTTKWHYLLVFGQGKLRVRACSGTWTENELKLLLRVAADFARSGLCDDLVSSTPD